MKKIKLNDIVKVNQSGEWGIGLKEGEIGTKVIRTADFNNDGSINYDNVSFRNIQQKKIDEKKLIYGDIIIEKSGGTDKNPVGRVVFFNDDNNIYLSNNFTQVIRIKESMNSKFVFYNLYFNYKNGSTLQMFNKTTGIQNLQMKQFLNQKISYISLEEQEIAVRKLDNVRNIIEIKQKQLQDLDELIKSQFIEMFGDININDKLWKEDILRNHLKVIGGYAFKSSEFKNSGIPILRIGNINTGYFRPKDLMFWNEEDKLKNYIIYPNDIVMSLTGTVGKDDYGNVCIMGRDYEKYYLNQRNAKLELKDTLDKIYISYALRVSEIKKRLTGISRGVRQANIANKDIENLYIPIPPIELQNQFADIVKQIDKQKFEIQKSLEEMQKLQESLMNKYFGG